MVPVPLLAQRDALDRRTAIERDVNAAVLVRVELELDRVARDVDHAGLADEERRRRVGDRRVVHERIAPPQDFVSVGEAVVVLVVLLGVQTQGEFVGVQEPIDIAIESDRLAHPERHAEKRDRASRCRFPEEHARRNLGDGTPGEHEQVARRVVLGARDERGDADRTGAERDELAVLLARLALEERQVAVADSGPVPGVRRDHPGRGRREAGVEGPQEGRDLRRLAGGELERVGVRGTRGRACEHVLEASVNSGVRESGVPCRAHPELAADDLFGLLAVRDAAQARDVEGRRDAEGPARRNFAVGAQRQRVTGKARQVAEDRPIAEQVEPRRLLGCQRTIPLLERVRGNRHPIQVVDRVLEVRADVVLLPHRIRAIEQRYEGRVEAVQGPLLAAPVVRARLLLPACALRDERSLDVESEERLPERRALGFEVVREVPGECIRVAIHVTRRARGGLRRRVARVGEQVPTEQDLAVRRIPTGSGRGGSGDRERCRRRQLREVDARDGLVVPVEDVEGLAGRVDHARARTTAARIVLFRGDHDVPRPRDLPRVADVQDRHEIAAVRAHIGASLHGIEGQAGRLRTTDVRRRDRVEVHDLRRRVRVHVDDRDPVRHDLARDEARLATMLGIQSLGAGDPHLGLLGPRNDVEEDGADRRSRLERIEDVRTRTRAWNDAEEVEIRERREPVPRGRTHVRREIRIAVDAARRRAVAGEVRRDPHFPAVPRDTARRIRRDRDRLCDLILVRVDRDDRVGAGATDPRATTVVGERQAVRLGLDTNRPRDRARHEIDDLDGGVHAIDDPHFVSSRTQRHGRGTESDRDLEASRQRHGVEHDQAIARLVEHEKLLAHGIDEDGPDRTDLEIEVATLLVIARLRARRLRPKARRENG